MDRFERLSSIERYLAGVLSPDELESEGIIIRPKYPPKSLDMRTLGIDQVEIDYIDDTKIMPEMP